jgi:hypothetical protein
MTVVSRPVLGQTACFAPSAMGSMPMSGTHAALTCSGLTPDQWAAMATQWPSPYVGQGATISAPASTPASPVVSPPVTTTTTYWPGGGHGVTIGSRAIPGYSTTTTVESQVTTAPLSAATLDASTTASTSTTCVTTPAPDTSFSYTPFAGHGTTIGSRASPTYTTNVAGPPPAPCAPTPTTAFQSPPSTAPGTPFHCTTTGFGGSTYGAMSMLDVIGADTSSDGLGRYITAALLNARSGRTPVLDETGVRAMWNSIVNGGYYEPTAGVQWGPGQVVAYLKTTMG